MPTGWGSPRTASRPARFGEIRAASPTPTRSIRCWTTGTRTRPGRAGGAAAGDRALLLAGSTVRGHRRPPAGGARHRRPTWAQGVVKDLAARSPTSLKITHRHVRLARDLDLRATLIQDFRLACRCLDGQDLYEGVRAVLIDRDRAPAVDPRAPTGCERGDGRGLLRPARARRARAPEPRQHAGLRSMNCPAHRTPPEFSLTHCFKLELEAFA